MLAVIIINNSIDWPYYQYYHCDVIVTTVVSTVAKSTVTLRNLGLGGMGHELYH